MSNVSSNKGAAMDIMEPGWWAIAVAALGGFIGWRVATAKDAVRVEIIAREQEAIKERIRALENGSMATATTLAKIGAQIDAIGHTLTRLEAGLADKADKS